MSSALRIAVRTLACVLMSLAAPLAAQVAPEYYTPLTPSDVPWTVEIEVTNAPSSGGTVDYQVTLTPTELLALVRVGYDHDGIAGATDAVPSEFSDLLPGQAQVLTGSFDLAGAGDGNLYVQVELFSSTACGDVPIIGEEYALVVLDDGVDVFAGATSTTELELDRISSLFDDGMITLEEAEEMAFALGEAPGEPDEAPPEVGPSYAGGSVTLSGTCQWTDGGGGLHPCRQVIVKAYISNGMGGLTEVGMDTAGNDGAFTISLPNGSLGMSPRDITLRMFSENFATKVTTPIAAGGLGGGTYFLRKTLMAVADSASVSNISMKVGNGSQAAKAWSIADAMIVGHQYINSVNGTSMGKINTRYPRPGAGTASYYSSTFGTMNIHPSKPFAWDVLLHEYGHYISDTFSLDDNPGGSHACNEDLIASKGKDPGARLAWGEGLATYLGIAAQEVTDADLLMVPNVGDTSYHSVTSMGVAWQYDLEARDRCNGTGEGVETNVGRCLWDVADATADGDDSVAIGHMALWQILKDAASKKNLSDHWNARVMGKTTGEKILLGKVYAQNRVSPQASGPVDGASISAMPPTFTWSKNKLNEFTVRFFDATNTEIGDSGALGDVATWTPSQGAWDTIRNATDDTLIWLVEGSHSAAPMTGAYWGDCRRMGGVDFAFVIDDTGSMSEEIGGVKAALLAFLSGFPPESDDIQFQLTTFKDSVTVRAPTNSLATIQSQVNSLGSSGGGDCPEESVGGLSQGTLAIRNGGTVLFATDADPRPGSDLGSLIGQLTASGARVNVLLSGTCFGSLTEDQGSGRDAGITAYVPQYELWPDHPLAGPVDSPWLPDPDLIDEDPYTIYELGDPDFTGAVDAYTQIASATGGTFAYVPEVNSFGSGATEYRNAAENILEAAVGPRIVLATPSQLTQGSTGTLTVKGQNTTFLGTTTIDFGDGVDVDDIHVVDPLTLEVTVTVDENALLGFRDASAVTPEAPPEQQTAFGLGVLEIIAEPFFSELLTATPSVVAPGDVVTVRITGYGTDFADGDLDAGFGSGVTVDAIEVMSDTVVDVDITVSETAFLGFRSVYVQDDFTYIYNGQSDFFRVSEASTEAPLVQMVVPPQGLRDSTLDLVLDLSGIDLVPDEIDVEFTGGGIVINSVEGCGAQVALNVTIEDDATTGARDVMVSSGGTTATGIGRFVVVSPKERLYGQRFSFKLDWKGHDQGKPNDSLTLQGTLGRAGLDLDADTITAELFVDDESVAGPLDLERKKSKWSGKVGKTLSISLDGKKGKYSVTVKKADLREAFPTLSSKDDGATTTEVQVKLQFTSSGLETPTLSNTLEVPTKSKAGKSSAGAFSFAKSKSLSGVFLVERASAKQSKQGDFSVKLAGPLVAMGGEPLDVDLEACDAIVVTVGGADPIEVTTCEVKGKGKPGKTSYAVKDKDQGLKSFGWNNAKRTFSLVASGLDLGLPLKGEEGTTATLAVTLQLTDDEGDSMTLLASVPLTRKSTKSTSWKR